MKKISVVKGVGMGTDYANVFTWRHMNTAIDRCPVRKRNKLCKRIHMALHEYSYCQVPVRKKYYGNNERERSMTKRKCLGSKEVNGNQKGRQNRKIDWMNEWNVNQQQQKKISLGTNQIGASLNRK